ncbi:MAG: 3-phosphoserine/phosphohydroxythreonine transaminase [Oscillospiraceae bacterium]|nr:3-phosphoserine/phosphohydroxythreonine transaminase [Oscillospiraceae bacterium]
MRKTFNFSAGPAVLPEAVLQEAAEEMMSYKGSGMSVMEISHRSSLFQSIIDETEADLRELMNIPDDYEVLFLQGGTSLQFSMIPMNFMLNGKADYILTGYWAKKAYTEAKRYGEINIAASSEDKNYSYIPNCSDMDISNDADYIYMCENNTIYGTKFKRCPNGKGKFLVNDVSSSFLSEPMNVSDYGMIFGGVQKNLAPAGLVIAIIHKSLISENVMKGTPTMLRYKTHADSKSLYNTPPTYNIYIVGKVIKWIKALGGLDKMQEINKNKAAILYDYLDKSAMFHGFTEKESRSLMNVTFRTDSEELDAAFVKAASANNIISIKGHRAVGGMRASLYNAMPIEGVKYLVDFMSEFERNGGWYDK